MTWDVGPRPGPPARLHSAASFHHERLQRPQTVPPTVPLLLPQLRPLDQNMYRPQSATSLFVPRPQQAVHPEIPRALDEPFEVSFNGAARFVSPPPSLPSFPQQRIQGQVIDHVPKFIPGDATSHHSQSLRPILSPPPFLLPPPPLQSATSWHGQSSADVGSVTALMASSSLTDPPAHWIRNIYGVTGYIRSPPPPVVASPRARLHLAAPFPSIETLQNALSSLQNPTATDSSRVAWIRDVLLLVKRASSAAEENRASCSAVPLVSNTLPSGPVRISDPVLRSLAESAVALLISIIPGLPDRKEELTPPLAEALFIRATITASGAFPDFITANPRNAFREFERSARAGFPHSWFRLGRDYEGVGDVVHARQCFEKGESEGDTGCIYRIGMAYLLRQLDFASDGAKSVERAAHYLQLAATLATIEFPHPPFVFALLLLGQFEKISIPSSVLAKYIPTGSNAMLEARLYLEKAAFLHFAPAQQHIGRAYEFAEPPFPFDPVLSKEYYTLASAGGDAQADLALSKWYLCGAEGYFGKDEELARDYAARAAGRGLPAAMFAMGYYCEVGIGGLVSDIEHARKWYEEAAAHGDSEADARLKALSDTVTPLSREQHDTLAETRLVRSRTRARMRADAVTDITPVRRSDVSQQEGQVFQRRQASLSSNMPPVDQYAPPVAPFQRSHTPQHSLSLPPPRTSSCLNNANYALSPEVQRQQQQQQFVDRPRYSLADPGVVGPPDNMDFVPSYAMTRRSASAGASPTRRQNTGSPSIPFTYSPRSSPRASERRLSSEAAPMINSIGANGTRYNTFEEMGIKGGRAEDKDCVIM
ncbi:hypothetical protein ACEPAF_8744 [Sanghuangporus sanghuang]